VDERHEWEESIDIERRGLKFLQTINNVSSMESVGTTYSKMRGQISLNRSR
jgi:hypothetical protein